MLLGKKIYKSEQLETKVVQKKIGIWHSLRIIANRHILSF